MDLFSKLSSEMMSLLRAVGSFAETCGGGSAYLIGEFPLEMLMGNYSENIEISIAGNLMFVAEEFCKAYNTNYKQKNSSIILLSPYSNDTVLLTQARDADIRKEIFERAFSIEGLCIVLSHQDFGKIHDPAGSIADLNCKVLRVMNRNVFRQNPINLIRAVRLRYKYSLSLDPITETLMNQAIRSQELKKVADSDISIELGLIKQEKNSTEILKSLKALKIIGGTNWKKESKT